MMTTRQLLLYSSVLEAQSFVISFGWPEDWRRSIRAMGGSWQGSFALAGPVADLTAAFYEWLGFDLRERGPAGVTWRGMIYDLELSIPGYTLRRSLDLMYNAISTTYQIDGAVSESSWETLDQSIARYGRREETIALDNAPSATAGAFRDTFLSGWGFPWARPAGIGGSDHARLSIGVCGYGFSLNWLFARVADGTTKNISSWIADLVGSAYGLSSDHGGAVSGAGDAQFIKAGKMETNTLQRKAIIESDQRVWDLISELAGLGDSTGAPWVAWVDRDQLLRYGSLDLDPVYVLRRGKVAERSSAYAAISPWSVWPGVFRAMDWPIRRGEPGSIFDDARDLFVEEIEVSADGTISLKPAVFDETEIMQAQSEGAPE